MCVAAGSGGGALVTGSDADAEKKFFRGRASDTNQRKNFYLSKVIIELLQEKRSNYFSITSKQLIEDDRGYIFISPYQFDILRKMLWCRV